jgi:hypothetical protein
VLQNSLPDNARVSSSARKALSHSAAIFVLYTTTRAMKSTNESGRKIISGDDMIKAMKGMGFTDFVPELEATLKRFRAEQNQAKSKCIELENHMIKIRRV